MSQSIRDCLARGPATSKEIQAYTGLSQAAVSRQLRAMGEHVIRLKSGRSPRYALSRNAFGANDALPLYMVDPHGNNTAVAVVRPLAHGGFYLEPRTGMPSVLLGERGDGVYDGLPYFLDDLRPQGFIGRQIAQELSDHSGVFPPDPRHWSTEHVGQYLISNGDDLPGNFQFGAQAHYRVRRRPVVVSEEDYPRLAEEVMQGAIPGSSAGGEQPKFTAFCGEQSAHVIVKFSPVGNEPVARRWRDILITEHHAAEAIHHNGAFPATETRLLERKGRLFLESRRFDRVGEYGRLPMVSLLSVDAEFTGIGSGWPQVMRALYDLGLVSWQHVFDAEFLWLFGRLINNTDMHLGNLSLSIDGGVFRILPVYDMCSMGFAPKAGEVVPYDFDPPALQPVNLQMTTLQSVIGMARDFWRRVSLDGRISDELRAFLSRGNPIDRL